MTGASVSGKGSNGLQLLVWLRLDLIQPYDENRHRASRSSSTGPVPNPTYTFSAFSVVQPHSENPQTWHFTHPSAYSNCEPQSGHVPMNASAS